MLIATVTQMLVIFTLLDVRCVSFIDHIGLNPMSQRPIIFQADFIKASIENEETITRGLTLV
jgi:hypothetical protein